MTFQISIQRLRLHGFHGVLPQERQVGADFYVTLTCEVEVSAEAWQDDQLCGTIDYSRLTAILERENSTPSRLLEHAAHRMTEAILRDCPAVTAVTLLLEKENPPLGLQGQGLGVKIEQRR